MSTRSRGEAPAAEDVHADGAAGYVGAIADALACVPREVGPTLVEPQVRDPDRALRVLGHFVATIEGFALGAIASHVIAGVRRWYGADGVARMRVALRSWPPRTMAPPTTRCDRDRPLVGELFAQLHVRFSLAGLAAQQLVDAIPRGPFTDMMLGLLARDDAVKRRIADTLVLGWDVYTAAVTTRDYPSLDPLWQQWQRRLDGHPVAIHGVSAQAGYIMLIGDRV